jgi:hypothetical protein
VLLPKRESTDYLTGYDLGALGAIQGPPVSLKALHGVTPTFRRALLHMDRAPRYEIVNGILRRDGDPVAIPKGLLYLAMARAGWKGEDGILSREFVRRLRLIDPRLAHLYMPLDRGTAA